MSDGSLSQEEIDALMSSGLGDDFAAELSGGGAPAPAKSPAASPASAMAVAPLPIDFNRLTQIVLNNTSALDASLRSLLDNTSVLRSPTVAFSNREELLQQLPDEGVLVRSNFTEQGQGQHLYWLPIDMAEAIAGKFQGLAQADLNDVGLGALSEVFNTLSGSEVTALSSATGLSVGADVTSASRTLKAQIQGLDGTFVKAVYPYQFDGVGDSSIIEIFDKNVCQALFPPANAPMNAAMPAMPGMGAMGMGFAPSMGMGAPAPGMPASVQPVQFTPLNPVPGSQESGNIGLLMDVYMEMTVELGRTKRLIKDILGMGEGTIIELDKLAGEPVDILVNHKLIAKGEVVVIDESFGVRVTEIVSPMERVSDF